MFGLSSHSDEEPAAAGRPPLFCPAAAVPDGTTQPSECLLRIMEAGEALLPKTPRWCKPHMARPGRCSTLRILLLIPVIKNNPAHKRAENNEVVLFLFCVQDAEFQNWKVQIAAVGYEIPTCYLCAGPHSHQIRSCSETLQGCAVMVKRTTDPLV